MADVRAFLQDRGAAVAVIFALSLVPVAGLAGIAVDYAMARSAQRHLQASVDAAALAAASSLGQPPRVVRKIGEDAFSTNMAGFPYEGAIGAPVIQVTGGRVEVSARVDMPTSLSGILGVSTMNVAAQAAATTASGQPLEIAFVIDITQSMGWNGSYETARAEIENLLTDLQGRAGGSEDVVASIVPFSDRVNVGIARGAGWVNGAIPPGWEGCLEPRVEPVAGFPYMESAVPPSTRGFTPTPGNFSILREGGVAWALNSPSNCLHEIIGPTANIAQLRNEMHTVTRGGTGRMDQGLAWAWRVLSPEWRGEWGRVGYPANHGDARKVIVFLGDGLSDAYLYEMGGVNGQPPAGEQALFNTPSYFALRHIQEMCGRIKASGIEIFVLYLNGSPRGQPYLQACASDPAKMYSVSNADALKTSFDELGSKLAVAGGPRLIR